MAAAAHPPALLRAPIAAALLLLQVAGVPLEGVTCSAAPLHALELASARRLEPLASTRRLEPTQLAALSLPAAGPLQRLTLRSTIHLDELLMHLQGCAHLLGRVQELRMQDCFQEELESSLGGLLPLLPSLTALQFCNNGMDAASLPPLPPGEPSLAARAGVWGRGGACSNAARLRCSCCCVTTFVAAAEGRGGKPASVRSLMPPTPCNTCASSS